MGFSLFRIILKDYLVYKSKKHSVFIIGGIAIALYLFIMPASATKNSCTEISDEQVKIEIHNNFTKLLPNYPSAKDKLGTVQPEFSWGNVERDKDITKKSLLIPFSVKGPTGKVDFLGTYICSNRHIEYSIDK